jgi:hypothetical protein
MLETLPSTLKCNIELYLQGMSQAHKIKDKQKGKIIIKPKEREINKH